MAVTGAAGRAGRWMELAVRVHHHPLRASRAFPDADLYPRGFRTYLPHGAGRQGQRLRGPRLFAALFPGMARRETHAQLERASARPSGTTPETTTSWVQFVGPANRGVVARYSDVNHDEGRPLRRLRLRDRARRPRGDGRFGHTARPEGARLCRWWAARSRVGRESLNRVAQYRHLGRATAAPSASTPRSSPRATSATWSRCRTCAPAHPRRSSGASRGKVPLHRGEGWGCAAR